MIVSKFMFMPKWFHEKYLTVSLTSLLINMIRYFLCLLVLCLVHAVSPYSPFRFRFRAFPDSSNISGNQKRSFPDYPAISGQSGYHKRSYVELKCRGMYDPSIFAKLAGICEDCYNLYRDPEVHGMCRKDCFSSQTFNQCLQSLLLEKESEFYQEMVQIIGKKRW